MTKLMFIVLIIVVIATACVVPTTDQEVIDPYIYRYEDDRYQVVCWAMQRSAIDCIPKSQLEEK